jgi:multidrug efflux pump subunit AcrB
LANEHQAVVKLVEDPPGPPVRSTMLAEIYGPDYGVQRQLARQVRQVFAETQDVVDIDDSVKNQIPQIRLVVDRDQVNRAGLSTNDIAQTVQMAIAGANVSTLKVPGELAPVAIQVRFADANRQSISDLTRIQLSTATGTLVPLSELVTFEPTTVDEPILHKDQRPVTYVMGEMGDRSSVYAVIDQMIYFFRHPLPAGYSINWDGEWKLTLDVFRDLGLAMLVAVLLIYLILVGQFRSFKVPLIMLGSIPLALIGILIGFSLNGVYFSATAMIGVIALAGIVVRNAIVLLEFIGDQRQAGVDLKSAILKGGAVRFRPILLTSVTTMLGTLSILSDPVWSGLAWTLLCGMLASSILTLVVIPLMYYGDQVRHVKPHPDLSKPPSFSQKALN